jgi:hypothetical protein
VLATLSTSRSDDLVRAGHATASALTSGYHLAFWIATALVGAAIAVIAAVPRDGRMQAAPSARAGEQGAGLASGGAELGREAA